VQGVQCGEGGGGVRGKWFGGRGAPDLLMGGVCIIGNPGVAAMSRILAAIVMGFGGVGCVGAAAVFGPPPMVVEFSAEDAAGLERVGAEHGVDGKCAGRRL
jgi:hypothetical protein